MECNFIESLCRVLSSVGNDNSSNSHDNVPNHIVVEGEQSNKVMQLSDVTEVGSKQMDLGYEKDEIPRVGMRFAQLQLAQEFYDSCAKKVGFATKIRMTTCDKMTNEPNNQAIYCNRDNFPGSRVKAPTQKNTISAVGCKARLYVKFDREKQDWVFLKVELRHSHPCSPKMACVIEDNDEAGIRPKKTFIALANEISTTYITTHGCQDGLFSIDLYGNRRMWVSIFFEGEFWAAIRSTQRSESMHAFYGGFLHSRTSLVQFVHKYDNKADCRVSVVAEEGESVCIKVEEKKLVNNTTLCVAYDVHFERSTQKSLGVLYCHCLVVFHSYKVYKVSTCYVLPHWNKNIKRRYTYVKSSHDVRRPDESHTAFGGLCAHFFNIAQDFVCDDDKIALLHAALEETKAKLTEHCAKKRSKRFADAHASIGSQNSSVVGLNDIQVPLKVTTKGRPKSKRLGTALEKSFKKSALRKNKNFVPVVHSEASGNIEFGAPIGRNEPQQLGGFMSLLSSFSNNIQLQTVFTLAGILKESRDLGSRTVIMISALNKFKSFHFEIRKRNPCIKT
ncbi:hypothetical protein Ahy_A06g026086 [Arachis hypogaea]|uniref:Protein FAR1-RELATED SEQUENCE n=1 Tax=Arachis hypogaea TaxID=3818 RepID=A0A445CJE0_ARAHY|nr:hypothetical protein Ahy_A06g026086 [Arachis hypogaea]